MKHALTITRRQFVQFTATGTAAAWGLSQGAISRAAKKDQGRLAIRECYCPAHFGNSYEAMWPREMAAYLAEMQSWGFNRYGDWITTTDVCNPYQSDAFWTLAMEHLARKKQAFHAAQDLGMTLDLIVTPNHVYLDQLRPEWAAKKGRRIST